MCLVYPSGWHGKTRTSVGVLPASSTMINAGTIILMHQGCISGKASGVSG